MGTNITGIGNANAIGFKSRVTGGAYFPPELKDALVGVWSAYGKSNDSTDRNIIKNKIKDKGGDFVISNAAFKLNSGFGKYDVDFTSWIQTNGVIASSDKVQNSITGRFLYFNTVNKKEDIPSFKVNITLGQQSKLQYNYIKEDGTSTYIVYSGSGIYTIPASYFSKYTGGNAWFGFYQIEGTSIIEQIPSFEGAFVTDGIDDLITSTKTVQEMLGGSNEITVVSMIHQVKDSANNVSFTNYIRGSANGYFRNIVNNYDKTGIYGYTSSDLMGLSVVNNILGDKNDYTANGDNRDSIINGNFSVQGYSYNDGNNTGDFSSVAWYWTIIANKVLTTDQINQVIAYFNLDRTLNPDILCNTIKQGITNENHAEFGDKLIDFSGNGRDIQLNNIAWKGDSGIGKYETELSNTSIWTQSKETTSSPFSSSYNGLSGWTLFANTSLTNSADMPSFKIQVKGLLEGQELIYRYYDSNGQSNVYSITKDGDYTLPSDFRTAKPQISNTSGFQVVKNETNIITITQIPSHAGALCLDGVNDFGKVTGMPIYKDYTIVVDYERISGIEQAWAEALISKSPKANNGAFILMETNGMAKHSYSFGAYTTFNKDDSTRTLLYQSKYKCGDVGLNAGTGVDGDTLWLGTYRDNYNSFFNGAIYSLMSFPYSMSEFLIERQLKKHKLGTLYPNMVEFRPIIKSNVNYQDIIFRNTSTGENLIVGQYYNLESISIYVKPLYYEEVSTIKVNNINAEFNSYDKNTGYYRFDCIVTKSPQKINLTIEQDENYVQWNPVITANVSNYIVSANIRKTDGTTIKLIEGDYYLISITGNLVLDIVPPNKDIDEVTNVIIDGESYTPIKYSNTDYYRVEIPLVFPKEIDITIDEYIRYEDIKQPYPVIFQVKDRHTSQIYSWGDKIKVGSSIQLIHGENPNLLPELYSIISYTYEGNSYSYNQLTNLVITVTKTISVSCQKTWKLGSNEPKCILSPKRLKLANSSYKYLGYIPDISGNGNNGAFTNFAFSGMSGAGGYVENFNDWIISKPPMTVEKTDSQAHISYIGTSYKTLPMFEYTNPKVVYNYTLIVEITGIPDGCVGKFIHVNTYTQEVANGINTIRFQNDAGWFGFTFYREDGVIIGDCNITIKQIGNYEGAICFDGIDDYVDIPSLSIGGKQVLMKTNWLKSPTLLYDQRASGSFAILTTKEGDANNPRIAYQARNQDGKTYIDGIENNYIETYSLKGITHNITVTNPSAGSGVVPVIGANTGKSSSFAKMVLYDFMLFDEVSTDEEIKQLNDIVGIEGGYVQKPPYYWDAYGKTNSDEDRSTIQQRGIAVGDYDLTNYNHAYEGMSGYNGYPVVFGTNKTYANLVPNDGNFILTSSHNIINVTKFDTSYGLLYSHIKLDGKLTSRNIDYPSYKIKVTGLGENFGLHYSYLESSSDTTVKGFEINNDGIYIIPKSFASDGSLTSNSDWIGFIFTGTAPESCNVTIEVLPEYENGLVYDGVDDYSENTSIPAFTDYTYIIKYEDFNNPNTGSCIQRKGSIKAGGGAFVQDHIYRGTKYQYNFGISSNIHKDDSIAFCTKTNYNGTAIPSGNNTDDTGFTIGKFDGYRKMVFYKEMLYPRTVNMLTINMIKNMMAEDGIIDIQGKLFTDKFTGDFNLDFNKDFLIGN